MRSESLWPGESHNGMKMAAALSGLCGRGPDSRVGGNPDAGETPALPV